METDLKSCILYMARNTLFDIMNLNISIYLIRQIKHYDNADIIVVSEEDIATQHKFHKISFTLPQFINKNIVFDYNQIEGKTSGYLHMCAFFGGLMFREKFLEEYDIITRMDTDGFLKAMVSNIPQLMYDNQVPYSASGFFDDAYKYTCGLDICVKNFCKENNLTYDIDWANKTSFNTNFEILNMSILRDTRYLEMFDYIHQAGGIYYYRWGDAPIRYLILESLGIEYRVMRGIQYKHQAFRRSMFGRSTNQI